MLEIQQDNKDELHVWVEGEILKFTMLEFAIIIGLKFTNNIDDYMYTSSSKSTLMSRIEDELQQRVGTIAEEFGDFNTIPPREILIKAGFASPVSLDQSLKKRKTVMFEKDNQAVMDDDTSGHDHTVHYVSGLYNKMHKDAVDKGEIGVSEIQHHHHREIGVYSESPAQDVNAADKEAGREDDFQNEDCSDLQALEDVNITAKEDVNEVNLKNQESTDVTDAQVRELQASKAKAPAKRERKKSRVLRSPYISKYGSGSKDVVDFDKEEKLKYERNGQPLLSKCFWVRLQAIGLRRCIHTVQELVLLDVRMQDMLERCAEPTIELSMQQDYAESIVVAKNEDAIANIIHGFCMPAGLPWYMVDEVYVPINYAYKGKITQQIGLINEVPLDVDYVQNIPQQASDSSDCGVFVCAYAEILSEGLQVHSYVFDAASQHERYAYLLWHYGVEKTNEGYTSDNGDLPRPRKNVIEEIDANAIVTLE
ncbi:hypothetical protein T459_27460 [Capsicum annuum]|uniref:Ubiquitin-like protease family profile domain-containing protein n=1 Tax=Capsicum annuum TaxID=4072 RepID=A0A2G2YDZ7_CAPAN|nr:hypothetical protein T459_27460 [Capsicum annuum]